MKWAYHGKNSSYKGYILCVHESAPPRNPFPMAAPFCCEDAKVFYHFHSKPSVQYKHNPLVPLSRPEQVPLFKSLTLVSRTSNGFCLISCCSLHTDLVLCVSFLRLVSLYFGDLRAPRVSFVSVWIRTDSKAFNKLALPYLAFS